jgi:TolB-like protein/Tfp pilus assembly protein PilF
MERQDVRFGQFRLDLGRRELSRAGTPVKLGSRALEILCVLAEAKGEVVSKDDMMARVWQGLIVEENNIQVHISALRKAIDEGDGGQSCVVTVPGRGYRLVGLEPATDEVDATVGGRPAIPAAPSIAVLPFQNLSNDPDQDYFADGIVEDIITSLSRVRWFLVIARNSSFAYKGKTVDVKQIGRELGVRYVLEGGIRKAGNRVRITAQLIETETGAHLWAERYDRQLDDIFALQDEITMSVVGAIEPNLRKAEIERVRHKRPDSLDAYDLVLRSLPSVYRMMAEGAATAIPLLEKALEADPGYARAHALLAWCYHFRFSRGGLKEEDRAAAIRHARAAIAGGSDEAPALAISGLVIWFDEHDAHTALSLFDRALAISESNAFALGCSAVALAWMGQPEVAVERAQRALRLSPFDSLNYMSYDALSVAHFQKSQYQAACDAALRAIESNPGFSVPLLLAAAALFRLGRNAEATAAAQRALSLNPGFTIDGYRITVGHVPEVFNPFASAWAEAGLPT